MEPVNCNSKTGGEGMERTSYAQQKKDERSVGGQRSRSVGKKPTKQNSLERRGMHLQGHTVTGRVQRSKQMEHFSVSAKAPSSPLEWAVGPLPASTVDHWVRMGKSVANDLLPTHSTIRFFDQALAFVHSIARSGFPQPFASHNFLAFDGFFSVCQVGISLDLHYQLYFILLGHLEDAFD